MSDIDLSLSVPVNTPLYFPVALAYRKEETMSVLPVEKEALLPHPIWGHFSRLSKPEGLPIGLFSPG